MKCPKCDGNMKERKLHILHGKINLDQCERCEGLWFDKGEAETFKEEWRSDFVDSGSPNVGKQYNEIRDINCPRCGKAMEQINDPKQRHIQYEACAEHGIFMDAGEYTDYKYETLVEKFQNVIAKVRGK